MKYFNTFLLAAATLLAACTSNDNVKFSSPTTLFVDQITAHTAGVISITDPIKVKLTKNMGDSLTGKIIEKPLFEISPGLEGKTYWQDNQTVVFEPASRLQSGQTYQVTFKLEALYPNLPAEKQTFKFEVKTLKQNFEVATQGIRYYSKTDKTKLKIEAHLQTADFSEAETIQKMVTATQNGQPISISWQAGTRQNTYPFTIENVKRASQPGKVQLHINGQPLGLTKTQTLEVDIPALDEFKVVSTQIVRGKENYISILFSDPLNERQNVNGLVRFTNLDNYPRTVIHVNELKIYPTQTIENELTLHIENAIKNAENKPLKENYETTLEFNQSKPAVRLVVENNKAIMPNSKGLIMPFEAVSLKAVEVTVIKIFEHNILQYLQVNRLGGDYQLRRVARPILTKTIPLTDAGVTNLNKWNRFSLNLEDIISAEPGAIYQINIGFRKKHALYFCGQQNQTQAIDELPDDWDNADESSYWDTNNYYYDYNYNWEERDNPCSTSYYGNRRSVSQTLFASELGIIAKHGTTGKLHVFITNLLTTQPEASTKVDVYNYQQQLIASGQTDSEGSLALEVNGKPFVLVAKKGNQTGYLKLDDGSSLSLSNFNVAGTQIKKGLKGFMYGERGVWRPADTVHLAFILQNQNDELPENHPVITELYNPSGQLYARKISTQTKGNIYRFDFTTPSDAPTGNWLAKTKVGGASFTKTVKIETIKPNRLKVNLAFDKEKFTANDRYITGDLNVRWLTGATASNLKAEYELKLVPVKTKFEDFPNYSFDDAAKDFYSERTMVYQGRVNADGYAKVTLDLGDAPNAPGALNAKLYGKVYEEGGDFSISSLTIPYLPYRSFVGVATPEGDKRGMLLTDKDHTVHIATVDAQGNPINRERIKVALYKLDWRWWWDTSYDYISSYVGNSYREPVQQATLSTHNGKGEWKLRINYPEWGRYYVQVTDPESGHSAGKVVYLDWPGWAGKGKRGNLDGAAMLDFVVEKEEYQVGDEIHINLPSTPGNRVLVSLETGSKLLQSFWVATKEGSTPISFEATPAMAPNIYVHLTMIQPHGQEQNDLPLRLYGVSSVKVVDKNTRLTPQLKMPDVLKPEETFSIEVSEAQGKPMSYTLAVVDEGLLDITNYKTPEPWNAFFKREALGVKTWDVYDDVIGAFGADISHLLAIGGDDELAPKEQKEGNRFKPVVKFLGPFTLKAGAHNKHTLQMPQYIGSVKTMVVAASESAYGHAQLTTPVKQPLMVMATLPRVAGPGETLSLPVTIFSLANQIKDVTVNVATDGLLTQKGKAQKTVHFTKQGNKLAYFELTSAQAIGTGHVKVTATSGKLTAHYDIDINVLPRNPAITKTTDKLLAPGQQWKTQYTPVGILGLNHASLEISSLPSLNIEQRLGYLIRYPHGCVEQTTSSVFAQLYLGKLVNLATERQEEIQKNINAAIIRLKGFQTSDGGFSYWPGESFASTWGSNYAGHFLVEAQNAGYAVSESMLANWVNFQTRQARAWSRAGSRTNNDLVQAYRLYTLALAGKPAMGAMNRLKEDKRTSPAATWRLALAYAAGGYPKQANKLLEGLSMATEEPSNYQATFGSATRDKAMVLETLLTLNRKEEAFDLLMDIANEMSQPNRWMSTQTTAYCFIALAKYANRFKLNQPTHTIVTVQGNTTTLSGTDFVQQLYLTQPDQPAMATVENKGDAPVFARLISTGTPFELNQEAQKRNISLQVTYKDLDGQPINITQLKQGTNFKAMVSITNPGVKGNYTQLALTQLFPSGWEIINTRLDGSEATPAEATYMDIRDDRVMHYFNLNAHQSVTFTVLLNAAYKGRYYLPAITVGAMYDNSIFANKPGKWVRVLEDK